jgi:hypothetical protein
MRVFSRNSNHVPGRAVRTPMLCLALVGGVAAHLPVVAQESGLVLEEVIVSEAGGCVDGYRHCHHSVLV